MLRGKDQRKLVKSTASILQKICKAHAQNLERTSDARRMPRLTLRAVARLELGPVKFRANLTIPDPALPHVSLAR